MKHSKAGKSKSAAPNDNKYPTVKTKVSDSLDMARKACSKAKSSQEGKSSY